MWIIDIFISICKFAIKHTIELFEDIAVFIIKMKSKNKNK